MTDGENNRVKKNKEAAYTHRKKTGGGPHTAVQPTGTKAAGAILPLIQTRERLSARGNVKQHTTHKVNTINTQLTGARARKEA